RGLEYRQRCICFGFQALRGQISVTATYCDDSNILPYLNVFRESQLPGYAPSPLRCAETLSRLAGEGWMRLRVQAHGAGWPLMPGRVRGACSPLRRGSMARVAW